MGFFDERILAALKDGRPRSFTALLGEVGFSHNTLRQHERLADQGLVSGRKWLQTVSEGPDLPIMLHPEP
jgi:predicted ArsR family transcriptional regulator